MDNLINFWKDVSESLSTRLSALSYEVWIATLEPVCVIDNVLVLLTPTASSQALIMKNHINTVRAAAIELNSNITDVEIILEDSKGKYMTLAAEQNKEVPQEEEKPQSNFIKKYTFDNFLVAPSNQFAAAASMAVAKTPGTQYNPLFIYGGVGLGKTHLLHSIANAILSERPELKVRYVAMEQFMNELIDSIKYNNDSKSFRDKYRNLDVLILDDVQFLAGKTGTQDAIFHTFNDLFLAGKQIILSSDRPAKEIAHLEERVRTRFVSGLVADIQPPDFETRVAILRKKCLQEKYAVDNVVLEFIAEKIDSNIREMEGLLSRVVFYSTLVGKPANSLELAHEALRDYVDVKKESINAYDIIGACCSYFGISKDEMTGKKKNKEIVLPRQVAMYLITDMLSIPLIPVGQMFGGRDHTTVMHARDKIAEKIAGDPLFRDKVKDIRAYITEASVKGMMK
jgi:chromosomal replication initiator protein